MYPYGSLGVPLVPKVMIHWYYESIRLTRYVERNKVHFAPFLRFHWNHDIVSWLFWCLGPLGNNHNKKGVESLKFSIYTQEIFLFSTYSPLFCCLSTRGPDISHPTLRFLYISGNPGLLCSGRTLNYHKRVKCCWIAFLASSGIFLQGGAPHPGSPHEMDPAKKNTFYTPLDKQWVKINS